MALSLKAARQALQRGRDLMQRRNYLTGRPLEAASRLPICKAFLERPEFQTPDFCVTSVKNVLERLIGGHKLEERSWGKDKPMTSNDVISLFTERGSFALAHYGYSQGYDPDSIHGSIVSQILYLNEPGKGKIPFVLVKNLDDQVENPATDRLKAELESENKYELKDATPSQILKVQAHESLFDVLPLDSLLDVGHKWYLHALDTTIGSTPQAPTVYLPPHKVPELEATPELIKAVEDAMNQHRSQIRRDLTPPPAE